MVCGGESFTCLLCGVMHRSWLAFQVAASSGFMEPEELALCRVEEVNLNLWGNAETGKRYNNRMYLWFQVIKYGTRTLPYPW